MSELYSRRFGDNALPCLLALHCGGHLGQLCHHGRVLGPD